MKKNFLKSFAVVAILGLTLTACNSNKQAEADADSMAVDSMSMVDSAATEEGVLVGGAMMVTSKNIVENALGSADHTTLVAAVKAADLVETLSGTGPFTVFAPTNEAFTALPAGTVDNLLKPEMKGDLAKVLTYHVVAGAVKAADLQDGMELTTVQGGKLKVTIKDGVVMINNAKVTIADAVSSNGVTHVIDAVLLPK
ncbi:fasciclin domain-containing protein [Pedobacter cryophilus]|uniref:Fasciclin domain-containing protein n=1 Tax=Pedobacter cryophilus TaxID=2571271 RepID=A0A4U1C0X6_9SPHI|nr:fasciclin domain-containing protein [Pedobacter cryophilus]TKB97533.1 fasciclin domain-containing protein [Pedobacter cryophilus]